jgi:hypothetical protein
MAVTAVLALIATTHEPVPLQAPDHPENVAPAAGFAVSVTSVPSGKVVPQLPSLALQSMPDGEDVTVPSIPPSKLTTKATLFSSTGKESSPPPQADNATSTTLISARRTANSERMEFKVCLLSILLARIAPTLFGYCHGGHRPCSYP